MTAIKQKEIRFSDELVGEKDCDGEDHDWQRIVGPADASMLMFRCSKCGAYGYHSGFSGFGKGRSIGKLKIRNYKCSVSKCKCVAIRMVYGRGPRADYLWRCRGCAEKVSKV